MRTLINLIGVVLLLGGIAMAWSRQSEIRRQRGELTTDPASLDASPSGTADQTKAAEIARLTSETRDLPRLRAELRTVKDEHQSLESIRALNRQLKQEKAAGKFQPIQDKPGFIPREQFVNSGQGTPENALKTFFWAMANNQVDEALKVASSSKPELREQLRGILESGSDGELEKLRLLLKNIPGIQVLPDRVVEDEVLWLKVKLLDQEERMPFRQVDGKWYLDFR